MWGSGFRAFRVWGLGFKGLGFRASSSELGSLATSWVIHAGLGRAEGLFIVDSIIGFLCDTGETAHSPACLKLSASSSGSVIGHRSRKVPVYGTL